MHRLLSILVRRHWHGCLMIAVLATLALITPQVNAAGVPPRSVFVEWPRDRPAPVLELTPVHHGDGSWSLDLTARGFVFSDLCQTVEGPQIIGHAHVYSGERKVAGAYVPRAELGHLRPGRHSFRVMLRSQDHRALVGPDGLIDATVVITVPEADAGHADAAGRPQTAYN